MMSDLTQHTAKLSELALEIPPFWTNPRVFTGLDKPSLNELAADIKAKERVIDPLTVQLVTVPGRAEPIKLVTDGQRRHIAAGMAKISEVPVVYLTEEPVELTKEFATKLLSDAMSIGNLRETISSYEQALAAARLKEGGCNGKEVSRVIRRSEAWVSRMTKALTKATPTLIQDWKAGKITDEQFKDLSDVKIEDQVEALKETRDARESGNKTEARAKVKELAAKFKAERGPSKAELKRQAKADRQAKKDAKKAGRAVAKPEAPSPPSRATLAHLVELGRAKPATHEYAKGVLDAIRYVLGELADTSLAKPWHAYIQRAAPGKPAKKPLKLVRKVAKATRGKVSADKLAAKAKGKRSSRAQRKADRDQVAKARAKASKK